ncbi:MAG: hypothetical protein AAB215_06015 [Planctomycetota bacterium]
MLDAVHPDVAGEAVLELRRRPLLELQDHGPLAAVPASAAEENVDALAREREVVFRGDADTRGCGAGSIGRPKSACREAMAGIDDDADVRSAKITERRGEMGEGVVPADDLAARGGAPVDVDELAREQARKFPAIGGSDELDKRAAPKVHRFSLETGGPVRLPGGGSLIGQ